MKLDNLKKIMLLAILILSFANRVDAEGSSDSIAAGNYRFIVYSLVSSAENSSLNYSRQYAYIENIGDGRGFTAGVIGFTTGTGDLLEVVRKYTELKPSNVLSKYIPTLESLIGSDSTAGLENFVRDWKIAARDLEMKQAQDSIVETMYLNPAVEYARADGLSLLGQFIYYDALVMHGIGDDAESFGGIRQKALRNSNPPSNGGDETRYLLEFLKIRSQIMQLEEAHADLSRISVQKKFLREKKFNLELPLTWKMYGDSFTLRIAKNFS